MLSHILIIVIFSVLHNNIRSLSKNLDDFQSQLLHELNTNFSIIGVTETRIVKNKPLNFNPTIPGYNFEYVKTPYQREVLDFI